MGTKCVTPATWEQCVALGQGFARFNAPVQVPRKGAWGDNAPQGCHIVGKSPNFVLWWNIDSGDGNATLRATPGPNDSGSGPWYYSSAHDHYGQFQRISCGQ